MRRESTHVDGFIAATGSAIRAREHALARVDAREAYAQHLGQHRAMVPLDPPVTVVIAHVAMTYAFDTSSVTGGAR